MVATSEKKKTATRLWQLRKMAEGCCHRCYKNPAGSDGGTKCFCGKCRRERNTGRPVGMPKGYKFIPGTRRFGPAPRPVLPEDLKFTKKPAMREGSERIDKMLSLMAKMDRLKSLAAQAGRQASA